MRRRGDAKMDISQLPRTADDAAKVALPPSFVQILRGSKSELYGPSTQDLSPNLNTLNIFHKNILIQNNLCFQHWFVCQMIYLFDRFEVTFIFYN